MNRRPPIPPRVTESRSQMIGDMLEDQKRHNVVRGVSQVVIPTRRPLAGLAEGFRGNSFVARYAAGVFGETKVASLLQTQRNSGEDAESLVVVLGHQILTPNEADPIRQDYSEVSYANLEWGIGGASFSATIDWQHGSTFSLPASFLKIGLDSKVSFAIPPVAGRELAVQYSAAVAYGTSSRSSSTRLTKWLGPIAAGGNSQTIEIPPFATAFNLYGIDNAGVSLIQSTALPGGSIAYQITAQNDLTNRTESSFPIPNGMRRMIVGNGNPFIVRSARVIFDLSLG